MGKFMLELHAALKNFFSEKMNRITLLLIISICLNIYTNISSTKLTTQKFDELIKITNNQTETLKNKTDHRFFCLTTTLKQIYDVDVDTKTGALKAKPPKILIR